MMVLRNMFETKTNRLSQLEFIQVVHQNKQQKLVNQQIEKVMVEE